MDASTRHFLTTTIVTVEELSRLTGIPGPTLQQQAYRGKREFVTKGNHQGMMLFDARDFAPEIARHQEQRQERHATPAQAMSSGVDILTDSARVEADE